MFALLGAVGSIASLAAAGTGRAREARGRRRSRRRDDRGVHADSPSRWPRARAGLRHRAVADAIDRCLLARRSGDGRSLVAATRPRRRVSGADRLGLGRCADPARSRHRNAPDRTAPRRRSRIAAARRAGRDRPRRPMPVTPIAIVGEDAAAVARSLIVQLAVQCGPADWRLVVVTDDVTRHALGRVAPARGIRARHDGGVRSRRLAGADRGARSARRGRPHASSSSPTSRRCWRRARARCGGSSPLIGRSRRS